MGNPPFLVAGRVGVDMCSGLLLFGDEVDGFSAMGAGDARGGYPSLFLDRSFLDVQGCFGDDGLDGGVERICDFLEVGDGDVSPEVVSDCGLGYPEFLGEVYLCHSPLLEDVADVVFDVHNSKN